MTISWGRGMRVGMEQRRRRWRSSDVVQQAAQELRHAPTQAEAALWEMLRSCRKQGVTYRRQVAMGPFVLDFYCAGARLAIEVDGGVDNADSIGRRDAERQEILEQAYGLRVVRVRNEDVLQRPIQTRDYVLGIAGEGKNGPRPPTHAGEDSPYPPAPSPAPQERESRKEL